MAIRRKQGQVRPPHPPRPLRSAVHTIAYELRSLRDARQRWIVLNKLASRGAVDQAQQRLVLECILLHARNLRDFFIGTKRSDDILALDFLGRRPRTRLRYLRSRRRAIDKLLSHPSYKRPRFKKNWDVDRLCSEIESAWANFISRLAEKDPSARSAFREEGL